MADKQYAQTIQRALNDQIASLLAQETVLERQAVKEESADRKRAAPPVPTIAPSQVAPPPAPASEAPPPYAQPAPGSAYGQASPAPAPPPAPPQRAASPLPDARTTVGNLDQRIARLMQVRDWIQEDGDIARLIDTVIGKQVRSSEQRQARLAIILNIVFLLAGWALSLIASPERLGLFH